MTTDTDAELIEAGRKLFAGDWQFVWASPSIETLPPMGPVEVAFAGRSNVGKSSLINALTGRRALARTSRTPGRTQELIFFGGPGRLVLVDLPGYGYAAAATKCQSPWNRARPFSISARVKSLIVAIKTCHARTGGLPARVYRLCRIRQGCGPQAGRGSPGG